MKKQNSVFEIIEALKAPMQDYRPIPFWSWNENLDKDELRRQIAQMAKSGVGGYFMHARSGLETAYLEQPWFDSVATGIEAGHLEGLNPWIYDEEGWPSGFAGGKVTAKGDRVYARGLRMRRLTCPQEAVQDATLLGVFACTAGDKQIVPLAQMQENGAYSSFIEMTHSCSPFYIDVMSEEVVKDFIEETHEKYAQRFEIGGKGLAGFFTDEPRLSEGPIPWSYLLPEAFAARYGYDLMAHLPALYLPCDECRAVRHDFWELVNDLFVNAYMKQLGDWCEAHSCKLTGHMMMEESLYSQMTGTGGGMPFYEFMQQPGVDSLRRNVNDPRIPKQVGSVAEQLGKPQVISESYAMSGWDLNFDEMRWIAGWQFVNGVNLICQHLQAYSLKGMRKRDYPPSLYHQQTWYQEYHRFNDALARTGQLLGQGKKIIDVLLLHPMHSGWVSYDGTNNNEIQKLDADFTAATEFLSGAHVDYHLGDETILKRHGKILADGRIQVGNYIYSAVLVPHCLTLDAHTVSLLEQFSAFGHPLVQLGAWPTLCAGRPSDALCTLQQKAIEVSDVDTLYEVLAPVLQKPIHLVEDNTECAHIHCCQVSTTNHATAVFCVNMSRDTAHTVTLTLPGKVIVQVLSMDTLCASPLSTVYASESTTATITFRAMETMVLLYEPVEDTKAGLEEPQTAKVAPVTLPDGPWQIAEIEDNILTLDLCEYAIDGGAWQPKKAVIHLMQQLLDMRRACKVAQRFTFTLNCAPASLTRLALVMEQPHLFAVTVNGHAVAFPEAPCVLSATHHYKDIAFCKADILPYLKQGENVVETSCNFVQSQHVYDILYGENVYETELNKLTYDLELESMYLLGDFGVYSSTPFTAGPRNSLVTQGPFVLDVLPKALTGSDFTKQGLAFFAGVLKVEKTIHITQTSTAYLLDLGEPRAAMVELLVNGTLVHTFLWGPFIVDIAPYLQMGENTIGVRLYASNRNMLGPHHHTKHESYSVGPISFTGKFSWAERESEAVVITPEMRLQNFWDDAYSFVTFGIE